ncbi:glycosyltransferase family 2 protein [Bacteroides acidifaciens]|jgi:glycosyltransferase involved in cell wall biosynthesis|uniref:glycosyltransferase n=1 Tax=Bacteroides acidifaciens TaxID=85831 RepID=UPI000B1272E3|nr:glycosyltransferase family 2 protein [Bacteroides acidifaciens]
MKSNNFPIVSVIVPIYNVENYLDECIHSIISQTYKYLDIILVDDESPDNSPEMCDDYATHDSRIRVIHKKNGGLGYARNSGLDIAKGEYVMFVDSDDYLIETAVETLVKYAHEYDAQFVKAAFKKVDDSKNILFEKTQQFKIFDKTLIEYELRPRMLGSSPTKSDSIEMSVWATLYRMDTIKTTNIRFDSERVIVSEDMPFNLSYLSYCDTALMIDKVIYCYRYNTNSLSEKYVPNKFNRIVDMMNQIQYRFPELTTREYVRLARLFFVFLRKYIKFELLQSDASNKDIINGISVICKNPKTIEFIHNYPINLLPYKQKLFLKLVKHNFSTALYCLSKYKLM